MNWIQEEDLKSIRKQADIVDITSRYLALTKKGKNYMAVCPFHDDHDPSLSISQSKQIYKCFVCGAGGDVFTFVSRMEQITFPEAVYKVAEMIHYPLKMNMDVLEKKENPNQKYFDLLQDYIQYTTYELHSEEGQFAYQYLKKRHINDDIIKDFEIGFAPSAPATMRFLDAKRFSRDDLNDVGLVADDNVLFHDRLMIPIHDENGNPLAFTARKLIDSNDDPKYINSSQTKIYEKGNTVFNYHRAKTPARKNQRLILVEGAMDVLAFEKADIHESVACLGTACTMQQLALLKRLQVPIYVCYDGDRAGQNATYKFCQMARNENLSIQIVQNTSGKDPDEIFEEGGKDELSNFVEHTVSYTDFLFDYLLNRYNLDNYEDKKSYAQEIINSIDTNMESFEKATYYSKLKTITGFDFSSLNTQNDTPQKKKIRKAPVVISMPPSGRTKAERAVLSMILVSKLAETRFKDEIGTFNDSMCAQLELYCYDLYRTKDTIELDDLLAQLTDEKMQNFLIDIWDDPNRIETYDEAYFNDALLKLKDCIFQEQIDYFNKKIEETSDPLRKAEFAVQKNKLIMQRKELRS